MKQSVVIDDELTKLIFPSIPSQIKGLTCDWVWAEVLNPDRPIQSPYPSHRGVKTYGWV
jgi:hypothetical protein